MNWIGGRLQRHSNSDTLTHRQRQHFARARTQLHYKSAASSSPFQPSFLQPGSEECEALDRVLGNRPPLKRQKGLDQYETVVPLVQRPSSMKPRPPTHRHISKGSTHDSSNADPRPLEPSCEGNLTLSPQAAVISRGKASEGREARARGDHDKLKGYRQERHASDGVRTDDVVERERGRLLARRDWAGLDPSRPVRMRFCSSRERETIGKRHKTFRNKTHKTAKDGATRAPFLERAKTGLGGPWMSGALANNEDINILIGTDALATQVAVMDNDSHRAEYRLTPSDPMLFNLEGPVQELQPIPASEYLATGSFALQREKEDTQNSANLPDTDMGSKRNKGGAEADPVEDVKRLLQELDGRSCGNRAAPVVSAITFLASDQCNDVDLDDQDQGETEVSDVHNENLMQLPTSLQELKSGSEGSSLDQAETRGQTKGQLELQSSPPKPFRLLFRSSPSRSSTKGSLVHLARAPNDLRSENSLKLPESPSTGEEGFDDIRWREVLGIASDRTDQSPDTRRTGSERRPPDRSIGEGGASSSAIRGSSADRAARPCLSAERPIDDAGHRASARSRWVEKSQFMARSPNSTFQPAANTFRPSCSDALHSQASERASDVRSPGSPYAPRRLITGLAGNASAATAQGWIGDADGGDEAEAIWKNFVFGEDDGATIDSRPEEQRQAPEPAVRSTLPPEWSTESSLLVEASDNSATAGTAAPSPACAHLHSVGSRYRAVDTADASAGRTISGGEQQASESIGFVEAGSTGEAASRRESRCLPVRIHDADAQANKASDDSDAVTATAGESLGELASLDRRERIVFTKPKAFLRTMGGGARPAAGGAAVEGNALKGTKLHTGPAGTGSGRKISNPRKRRRDQQTAGLSPSIYGIPSRGHTGIRPN